MSALAIQPDRPSFDERELLDRLDGDEELLVDLAQTFIENHKLQMAAIRAARDAGDVAAMGRAAHAIKGALATLAAEAATHAAALERAAKEQNAERCGREAEALEASVPKLIADLEARVRRGAI